MMGETERREWVREECFRVGKRIGEVKAGKRKEAIFGRESIISAAEGQGSEGR
jgi:hypothetical protein